MIAKKDCTKTLCPLCERKCQVGSTNSGFIENNGACLVCLFGKTQAEIDALLLAKKINDDIKNAELLGIDLAKNPNDKGVVVTVSIDKNKCIQDVDVTELNSVEIDNNSCDRADCQHRKNIDENKVKSPARFKDYEIGETFIRNENDTLVSKSKRYFEGAKPIKSLAVHEQVMANVISISPFHAMIAAKKALNEGMFV